MRDPADDLLVEALSHELESQRLTIDDLATELEVVRLALSAALTLAAELHEKLDRQTAAVRSMMGEHDEPRPKLIPAQVVIDHEPPEEMVRASEIRWTAFDER